MWNYIANKRLSYTATCNEENVTETATTKKLKKICGYYHPQRTKLCPQPRSLKYSRDLVTTHPWQLPPNRYDVLNIPFKRLQGASGANWAKVHTHKALPPSKGSKQHWKFYELGREMERMHKRCHLMKGIFLTNARDRRASTRCMVSSPITCYHDPEHPGPTTYFPKNHLMKIARKIKQKLPNPHIFLRNSCVPQIKSYTHKSNISFAPGPGRYETRYPNNCPCLRKKMIYQPGLHLIVDRQKRLKFRRQHFTRFHAKKYCSPDWRHVIGHGHTYLFKNIPPKPYEKPRLKTAKDAKKTDRQFKLYPDARYIGMINDPAHQIISERLEALPVRPTRIVFNCMTKRVVRRQLRNNKKIAFNSGQERFKDAERAPLLSASEQEAKKKLLPIERQLRDHPITNRRLTEIQGKLHETPLHMKPAFELELRKRLFKFLPLPTAKVLVTDADLMPEKGESYVMAGFFGKELNVLDYLKDTVDPKDLQEIKAYREMRRI